MKYLDDMTKNAAQLINKNHINLFQDVFQIAEEEEYIVLMHGGDYIN